MIWVATAIYLVGTAGTFIYNGSHIIGPINYRTVIRNAILWPIFLPILIWIYQKDV